MEWNEEKRRATLSARGVDFADVERFEWETAFTREDTRGDYGECRFVSDGLIDGRLHVLVFTPRDDTLRIISLRKANARERRRYEQAQKLHRRER